MKNLLFLVFVFSSFSYGSPVCRVLVKSSNFSSLEALFKETQKLPGLVGSQQAQAQVDIVAQATRRYLQEEGFSAVEHEGSVQNLSYPLFVLEGKMDGGELSRKIYEYQKGAAYQDAPLMVILDIFQFLNRPGFLGLYDMQFRSLTVGPEAFYHEMVGAHFTVSHEIGHYLEHTKILKGELTLARIELTEFKPVNQKAYSGFLRTDELEMHIEDLKKLQGDAREEKGKMVAHLLKISKPVWPQLRELVTRTRKLKIEKNEQDQETLDFYTSKKPYSILKINLHGLINKSMTPEEKRQKILELIDWSERRAQEIEAEFLSLKREF